MALAILALARPALPLKSHTHENTHMHHNVSDRIGIDQEQPKAARDLFRLRGAKPALIPQPTWHMYHVRS
jgi:hypothetical protein